MKKTIHELRNIGVLSMGFQGFGNEGIIGRITVGDEGIIGG